MKRTFISIIAIVILLASGIWLGLHWRFPKGISATVNKAGKLVLILEENTEIIVSHPEGNSDRCMLFVANVDGVLGSAQFDKHGRYPISVEYTSSEVAKITVTRGERLDWKNPFIIDSNGDGIPEFKVDPPNKFRLKTIEWEQVEIEKEKQNKSEMATPRKPSD